jgi:hypothetical protein
MTRIVDLTGQTFGRLTVLSPGGRVNGTLHWLTRCVCGTEKLVYAGNLRGGNVSSCGCLRSETSAARIAKRCLKHGLSYSREFASWQAMKTRCCNSRDKNFLRYGAKGITVCDRWKIFENFYADMGPRPEGRTLDRIDNTGNYEPSNCRWATLTEQQRNRAVTVKLTLDGQTLTLMEWSEKLSMEPYLIRSRLSNGWSVERALTEARHKPQKSRAS